MLTEIILNKMKAYHFIDDLISEKSVNDAVSFIENNQNNEMFISINSPGGSAAHAYYLISVLNAHAESITLTAINNIGSAGFIIFRKFKGKKRMCSDLRGMWHPICFSIDIAGNGKPYYGTDKGIINNLADIFEASIAEAKSYMTPKELEQYKKNDEVCFTFSRMKEIFPDAEII